MIARLASLLAFFLALAACGEELSEGAGHAPSPLLFEITDGEGEVQGWMFGTIHALPDGTVWRTKALEEANAQSDFLIVEISNLGDRAAVSKVYNQLASNDPPGPFLLRVDRTRKAELKALLRRSSFSEADFDEVETWASALMLAQLAKSGKSENGVDRAIIRDFRGRDILEFEGARKQLSIFDRLAQEDQRDLLHGVMDEIAKAKVEPGALRKAWLQGDEETLIKATQSGIMADPELYEAMLVKRNQDWLAQLLPILSKEAKPMVAVGAGHLIGPDGLPALLEQEGYIINRIQ